MIIIVLYDKIYYCSIIMLRVITNDSQRPNLPPLPPTPGQFTR
jgi:hypothetical protein